MFAAFVNGTRWTEATAIHDGDAVAYSEEFGQVTADEENGFALGGELVNQAVDVGFAGDVNAARGFVQKQAIHVVVEQAGERDFLLVAAGEVCDEIVQVPMCECRGEISTGGQWRAVFWGR